MKGKEKRIMKKLAVWGVSSVMSLGLLAVSGTPDMVKVEAAAKTETSAERSYDYGRAWQQTLMFYEFQKSGKISEDDPSCNRNNWKGDCEWNDGEEVGLDLTGGWHDAGDHVKFNLPMAYSVAMLTWSYLEYKDTYDAAGQTKYMLNEIKWVNDYLIKCHADENLFYYQVGDGDIDHQFWGAPELIDVPGVREIQMPKISRPCFYVTNEPEHGGSAVCAESAAALAAASIAFQDVDPEYSATCIKHAKELYQMALEAQSDVGYMEHAMGYYSSTHFEDELSWGGAWLYKATGEKSYLDTAEAYDHKWGGTEMTGDLRGNVWTQCWDDVRYGAMLLIAQLDDSEKGLEHKEGIEYSLDYWSTGVIEGNGNPARGKYTDKGLVMINDWGSVRYAGAQAAMAMFYCNWDGADPERVEAYKEFAKSQADYILGSTGRSYIVGYDETSPRNPHHRTADGPWKNSPLKCPDVSRHTLVGAVVGGPDGKEVYDDNRNNYCTNEVANDYNAGPLCLMAAMYAEYGGTIDPDINAVEEVGEEYYMDGCNYQKGTDNEGSSFCEVKLTIENHTAWPARPSEKLKFRYFVNIKDALEQGAKPEDFSIISYYAQRISTVTELIPWNEEEGIYYVEVAFGQDEEQLAEYDKAGIRYEKIGNATSFMYPGGDVECRADMQLRIASPAGVKWDYTKNPSYVEIKDTEVDQKKKIMNIPVYEGDKLVGGIEPNKTGEVDLTIPDIAVDEISIGTTDNSGQVVQNINYSLDVGETCQPNVVIKPTNATDKTLTWKSMNTNVATVDADGVITGVGKGSTSIIVWANGGGKLANCVVDVDGGVEDLYSAKVLGKEVDWTAPEVEEGEEVSNSENPRPNPSEKPDNDSGEIVEVEAVTFSSPELTLEQGYTQVVKPIITPLNATEKTLTWVSDNPDVAAVTTYGLITAKEEGTATLTATAKNGVSGSLTVTVIPGGTEVEKVTLTPSVLDVKIGDTKNLKATILPKSAVDQTLTWESDNLDVAEVTERGDVIAKSIGSAVITATASNGISGSAKVNVNSGEIEVKTIVVSPANLDLEVGDSKELLLIVSPQNAVDTSVTWSSGKPEVAEVSEDGVVTAKANGTTVITATAKNGTKGTANVRVGKDSTTESGTTEEREDEVESISILPPDSSVSASEFTMGIGVKKTLKVDIVPQSAANQTLTWSSSDVKIADVSSKGEITAKSAGKAVITVTAKNGVTSSIKVEVVTKESDTTESGSTTESERDDNQGTTTETGRDDNQGTTTETGRDDNQGTTTETGRDDNQGTTTETGRDDNQGTTTETGRDDNQGTTTETGRDDNQGTTTETGRDDNQGTTTETGRDDNQGTTTETERDDNQNTTTESGNSGDTGNEKPAVIDVESVTVTPNTLIMYEGDTYTLEAEVAPKNATVKTLTWKSSNKKAVVIPDINQGTILAKEEGTAVITVTAASGVSSTVKVTVKKKDAPDIDQGQINLPGSEADKDNTNASNENGNTNPATANNGDANVTGNTETAVSVANASDKPAKVTGLKKKLVGKTWVKLGWKKQNDVSGYAVYRYDKAKHKWKLYKKTKGKSITVIKLKKGVSYKFKVRAYKKISGEVEYGAYSKTITVKTKK